MRKVVQMVSNNGVLFAAADDGTVWWWGVNGWEAAPDLPTEPSPVQRLERKLRAANDRRMSWYQLRDWREPYRECPYGPIPHTEPELDAWRANADAIDKADAEKQAGKRK